VNRFYELVVGDERLAGYFEGVEMVRLKRHQVALVSPVMGAWSDRVGKRKVFVIWSGLIAAAALVTASMIVQWVSPWEPPAR